jgi:hypothetical protein
MTDVRRNEILLVCFVVLYETCLGSLKKSHHQADKTPEKSCNKDRIMCVTFFYLCLTVHLRCR